MNPRSLTFRLIFRYSVLLLILGIGLSVFTLASFRLYVHETLATVISSRANDVWNMAQGSLNDPRQLASLIERRFSPAVQDRFIRVSLDGRVIYQSGYPADHVFDPGAIPSFPGGPPKTSQYGKLMVFAHQLAAPGGRQVAIESGQTDEFAQGFETSLATSLIIGLPVLLIMAAMGGYVLIRRTLTPVEMMITAAEAITFNDPGNRLPLLGTADRIEALALALNRMLDRLDNAYQHANRFSLDAAHELRTPLAIIRAGLEYTVFNRALAPETKEALGELLDEVTRLGSMTDNLLTLSRMESLWGKRVHTEVDLFALASEVVEQMQFIADEKDIALVRPSGRAVIVSGDRDRLKQVLVNLLDNAIKYNRRRGTVTLDVSFSAGQGMIEVADTGIGIAPEAQKYIFDRFYRVSTDRGHIGAGLGLAIAQSICHAHGGALEVNSIEGQGSVFRIRLPSHLSESHERN